MNIGQAKWMDPGNTMCRASVDGVETFIPAGSPHWPYLQAAIAAGLVVAPYAYKTPAEIALAIDAEATAAVSAPALVAWVKALLAHAEEKGAFPVPAQMPAVKERALAQYKREKLL